MPRPPERGCHARLTALALLVTVLLRTLSAVPVHRPPVSHQFVPAKKASGAAPANPPPASTNSSNVFVARTRLAELGGDCLLRFRPGHPDFEPCKTKTCFIFLREEPYIRLDTENMVSEEQTILFNCINPTSAFPGLGGTAFEVIKRTSAKNSMCVWGGPKCLFNHMVNFIDETARTHPEYAFAATGLLLENSARVRERIIPSTSLIKEELVIFGVDDQKNRRDRFPIEQIVHPFKYDTWGLFAVFFWAIVIAGLGTVVAFGPRPFNLKAISAIYVHSYSDSAVASTTRAPSVEESFHSSPEEVERVFAKRVVQRLATYKVAKRLIRIALSAMIVIFLLFYELAVAQFLFFEQKKPALNKSVRQLSWEELRAYSVEKNAATETVWNRTVFEPGKYTKDTIPWHRCATNSHCFDQALNSSSEVRYVVGFKSAGTYQVLYRSKCKDMTLFRTENELYSFGAGWLYGSGVHEGFRRAVDRDIVDVDLSEELHAIAERDAGTLDSADCKTEIRDVDVGILGVIVLVLTVPILIILIFIMVFYCLKRIPAERQNQELLLELEPTAKGSKEAKQKLRRRRSLQSPAAVHSFHS